MKNGYIYLDNAGTSIPHETVKEAATEYVKLLKEPALLNRRQADILSDARRAAAAFLKLRWFAAHPKLWVRLPAVCR